MQRNKYRVTDLLGGILDRLKPLHHVLWERYEKYDGEDENELESVESAYYAIDYVYGMVLQKYHEVCEYETNNGSVNWKRTCELFMLELHRCEQRAHENQRTDAEAVYKITYKTFADEWTKEANRLAKKLNEKPGSNSEQT